MAQHPPLPRPTTLSNQYNLVFSGKGAEYAVVWLPWALATVITGGGAWLGWQARKRKYLYENLSFLTLRFGYSGTGGGACLVALPWLGLATCAPLGLLLVNMNNPLILGIASGCLGLVVISSLVIAAHRLHSYHINQIKWGQSNLHYQTSSYYFTARWLCGGFATLFSFGLYLPYWRSDVHNLKYGQIRCGEWGIMQTGKGKDLFEDYVSSFAAIIISAGLFMPWLHSKIQRYRLANTWVGGERTGSARGYFGLKGPDYFALWITQVGLRVLTLGAASPWLTCYGWRAKLNSFAMMGNLDISNAMAMSLEQDSQTLLDRDTTRIA